MTYIIPPADKWYARVIGTLTGFAGVGLIDLFTSIIFLLSSEYGSLASLGIMTFYYILFGLPIALTLCFILGTPLYFIFIRNSPMTRARAITLGVVMGHA